MFYVFEHFYHMLTKKTIIFTNWGNRLLVNINTTFSLDKFLYTFMVKASTLHNLIVWGGLHEK